MAIDAGLGVASPWDENVPAIDVEGIRSALTGLLVSGLPASIESAGPLLELRSVMARAVHPYDPVSRLDSLNKLLVRLLVELGDGPEAEASRIVFAIALGTKGTTHTTRRGQAADRLGYDHDHFRKRVEPRLVRQFAEVIYTDLLRYKRRIRRAPESEEPTGDTPSLTSDDFTHQEELISRIWQHVYALRAEIIAAGRLGAEKGYESPAEDHRQAAAREQEALQQLLREYVEVYGKEFIQHGEAEYSPLALCRLLSWTGKART